jgi:hypothetical protein
MENSLGIGTLVLFNRIKGKVSEEVIKGVECMSERFELSFKNKEVRMGFHLAVPTFTIGSLIIFYGEKNISIFVCYC